MKKIMVVLLSVMLLLTAVSCGNETYADNVSANALAGNAVTALQALEAGVDYAFADEGYLDDYFQMPDYVSEYTVIFATEGNNLNEFGIFHVKDGNTKNMKSLLEQYLKDSYAKNQSWYDSYIPEETPKLRDAEVKTFGNYAVYAIAQSNCRSGFFQSIKDSLTEK